MANISLSVTGLDTTLAILARLSAAATIAGRIGRITVGSTAPYAYGIETGRRMDGRLARKAGGTHALQDSFEAEQPGIPTAIGDALLIGPEAVTTAMDDIGIRIAQGAANRTASAPAVVSGRLRDSFVVTRGMNG